MSDAGILYLRLSHMADFRGAGHPPAPAASIAFEAALSAPQKIPETPKTPPKRLHSTATTWFSSKRRAFLPSQHAQFSPQLLNRRSPDAPKQKARLRAVSRKIFQSVLDKYQNGANFPLRRPKKRLKKPSSHRYPPLVIFIGLPSPTRGA